MSSSAPARRRRATYADIEALPEGVVGEIIEGELCAQPRPAPRHGRVASRLGIILGAEFDEGMGGRGGWVMLDEPEIQFGANVLVPDLAGWHNNRLLELPEKGPLTTRPDWVCEILSPSTGADDRRRKLPIYAGHGVEHVWLIDPLVKTLEVFKLRDGQWDFVGIYRDSDLTRAEPFETLEIPLDRLWGNQTP